MICDGLGWVGLGHSVDGLGWVKSPKNGPTDNSELLRHINFSWEFFVGILMLFYEENFSVHVKTALFSDFALCMLTGR